MSRRWARATAALAGALALLAVWLGTAPVRVPRVAVESGPPVFSAAPVAAGLPPGPEAYGEVVERSILSPTRQAPATRRTPGGQSAPARASEGTHQRRLHLSGIVRGADGYVVLIDADPAIPGSELYRLGDRVGPYRLVEATDSSVVLRGASGAQVLRFESLPGRIA